MFTGIIREVGIVSRSGRIGKIHRLEVMSKEIYKSVNVGDSVAVNGVCLTVTTKRGEGLSFDAMEETLGKTTLANLKKGDFVNLENSLKAQDALGGHFVLGHIDCVGTIKYISKTGDAVSMDIGFPENFSHLIVEKGSVALDGISLTIGEVKENAFRIYLIPQTLKTTTLGSKPAGARVNLEFDIIGKYIARYSETNHGSNITEKFLNDKGFL
ncbi:MAG: riboflavin synthase subunit alpha [Omnitrophica bacterium RIFCSPLOWO2_01_FULL_45_10]|nr:MAG: riboflavin synthase subunit alpha [Omnitrophica bacterium RIFCSPLOWO2_01_FULL_45_10]